MSEVTLSPRNKIQNSNPGGLKPSTPNLGQGGSTQYEFYEWKGKNIFVSFKPPRPRNEPRTPRVKVSSANHNPRAPTYMFKETTNKGK